MQKPGRHLVSKSETLRAAGLSAWSRVLRVNEGLPKAAECAQEARTPSAAQAADAEGHPEASP